MRTPSPKSTPAPIQEITGRPASLMGRGMSQFILPGSGTITLKIVGDVLHTTVESQLNKRETWTRIQNIDSIEIVQAPIWGLLTLGLGLVVLGVPLLRQVGILGTIFTVLGIGAIAAFCCFKHRYLCIHSQRTTLPVGLTKPAEIYQQFSMNVLLLARQLNTLRVVLPPTEATRDREATQGKPGRAIPTGSTQPGINTVGRVAHTTGHTVGHPKTQLQ
ncbi:MAG: hypothetical protein NW220_04805 [Leptolyngbyaceae cyanobacterium bins.349]|nr:hypothetical protein [Leptolyngbyaceae cyanobacterium bins.349]